MEEEHKNRSLNRRKVLEAGTSIVVGSLAGCSSILDGENCRKEVTLEQDTAAPQDFGEPDYIAYLEKTREESAQVLFTEPDGLGRQEYQWTVQQNTTYSEEETPGDLPALRIGKVDNQETSAVEVEAVYEEDCL